jgi:hypothetical protein
MDDVKQALSDYLVALGNKRRADDMYQTACAALIQAMKKAGVQVFDLMKHIHAERPRS